MHLDILTASIFIAVGSLISGLTILLVERTFENTLKGGRAWAYGNLLHFTGWLLALLGRALVASSSESPRDVARITGATSYVLALVFAARSAHAFFTGRPQESFFEMTYVQDVTFFASFVAAIVMPLGFIGMNLQRITRDLEKVVAHDTLTGVLSRAVILERLHAARAQAMRIGEPLSILMIDIDNFKAVNDSQGHLTGDAVLKKLAELFRSQTRAQDSIGRFGGDEFLFLLPGVNRPGAVALARRLLARLTDGYFDALNLKTTPAVSIGAAEHSAEDTTIDHLIERADAALYAAKAAGGHRVAPAHGVAHAEQGTGEKIEGGP